MSKWVKELAEVAALITLFVAFCVLAGYLLMDLVGRVGVTMPPPPW